MLRQLKQLDARTEAILVNSTPDEDLTSSRVDSVDVNYQGFRDEAHSGLTRESCVRVRNMYREGTEIRNTRQISILSVEDLSTIAQNMGISNIEPEWVGANLLLAGIPNFTKLPPSTRLIFDGGASLVIDMENSPCKYPGEMIERHHPGSGKLFANSAVGLRGVTAWVEREGRINHGDPIQVFVPPQQIYDIP